MVSPNLLVAAIPLAINYLNSNSKSSENGTAMGGLADLLQNFLSDQEETVQALFADGANGGTASDKSGAATVGVLEIMVIPPTASDPTPRLRWKTNGPIIGTPQQVLRVAERFVTLCKDEELLRTYEEAVELVPQAEADAKKVQNKTAVTEIIKTL